MPPKVRPMLTHDNLQQLPLLSNKEADEGRERLCDRCIGITLAEGSEVEHRYLWHDSYEQLERSAQAGCELCEFVNRDSIRECHLNHGDYIAGSIKIMT